MEWRGTGLRKAIAEVFAEAAWQRCYVHFLPNAGLPAAQGGQRSSDRTAVDLRPALDPRSAAGSGGVAEQMDRTVSESLRLGKAFEETRSFYPLPGQHHKNLKSTNLLERLNEEIKRRTLVVRISPLQRRLCA
jgi:putative transposase